jgi:putative CocE/NonD family hydrolase
VDNGVDREPALRYFVMGKGIWKQADAWPPPHAGHRTLYLSSRGHANGPEGDGVLTDVPPADSAADSYDYDPQDPVPTLWTRALFAGASDRRKLAHRRDILVYRTKPLEEPLEVVGDAEVVLFAATTAPDTDFFARLIDETPDGPATEVAYGMVRARHRNAWNREDLLTPGQVVEYRIRLTSTAICFQPGHRIRLDITSSDFPNFDRNHNTGRNDLLDAELAVARQTLFHDAAQPSHITLPLAT